MQTILILAANPKGITPLRLDEQVREIDAGLQRARHREQFVLEQKWAVRPRDIQRAMLDINPQIVHFSGHGTGDEGLVFEDETGSAKLVDGEALAGLFQLFADQVECVVLNGCYSEIQAEAISQYVNYVIGMKKAIGDKAAIEFAVGFYDALGSGKPVEFAYKFGCAAIRLAGITEQFIPILKKKPNIEETIFNTSGSKEQPPVSNESAFQAFQQLNESDIDTRILAVSPFKQKQLTRLKEDYSSIEIRRHELLKKLHELEGDRDYTASSTQRIELERQIIRDKEKLKDYETQLESLEQKIELLESELQGL
ncbi:MAG: CHAT domain-containing protein [Nostoc sp. DedQUE01]|nr:CHAT domain-containing protein [Nostoc sp. DedQUE11]MDZ8075023.1 CHAT domain-containing protein [Nostoc sp. DedQUE01]MDZ8082580.1 CHAT domain-containing protein [Nostoc sp. DcaGUA01]